MIFPFPNKTLEESEQILSDNWDYDYFPFLLKPKDGRLPLTKEDIDEIQSDGLRYELLKDGRIFSLDPKTSDTLFNNGYTVDTSYYVEHRKH